MNHAGRWYLVSKSLFEKPDGLYHWGDPKTQITACGWPALAPHVSDYQSYSQRRKLRCASCSTVRGTT